MHRTGTTLGLILAAGLAAGASLIALAGPLDPPAGPVSSTYKTLSEIEPRIAINATNTPGDADSVYRITAPGSYYLTGNISGANGKHAIEIDSDNVTLDLNGFTLQGVAGSLDGINLSGFFRATFKNGVIQGFGRSGIEGSGGAASLIAGIKVTACGQYGIAINSGSVVRDCIVSACTNVGIITSNGVIVENCVAGSNGTHGIQAGTDSIVRNCIASGNVAGGITTASVDNLTVIDCIADGNGGTGIACNDRSSVAGSVSRNNGQAGISCGIGSLLRGCSATDNTGDGFVTLATCSITACTASGNGERGFETTSSTIAHCTARENGSDGFYIASGSVITACTAAANLGDGISTSTGNTITQNTCSFNGIHGIDAAGDNRIVENSCDNNGATAVGAGIHIPDGTLFVINSDCRIEGNNCTDNDYGIWLEDTGNLAARNSASSNASGNYNIVAGNAVAAIVNVAGNGAFSSTNTWSNLEF